MKKSQSTAFGLFWKLGSYNFTVFWTDLDMKNFIFSWKPTASTLLISAHTWFFLNFFIQYSLFAIVEHEYTNRINIWCKISRLEVIQKQRLETLVKLYMCYACKKLFQCPPPHLTLNSNSNDYVLHVLIEIPLVTYQWWNAKLRIYVNFYMNGLRVITPNYAGCWPRPTDTS